MPRRRAGFALWSLTGALTLLACGNSAPSDLASCIALAECCGEVSTADQSSCESTVASANEGLCASFLTSHSLSGGCSQGLSGDGGVHAINDAAQAGLPTGPSCRAPAPVVAVSADCSKCETNCETSEALFLSCQGYFDCFCPCAVDDKSCQQACVPLMMGGCEASLTQTQSCITQDCASLCGLDADD